ncbi:MAG: hypothetical protein Roseis2KO_15940 [Roseivirga sp.]
MNTLDSAREKLIQVGLKATQQRMVILGAIAVSTDHPSAEKVYEQVRVNNPSISLGTVYSTLETFVDKGLIQRVLAKDGVKHYDGRLDNHNHIHCVNTNEIIDFEDQELNDLVLEFLKRKKIENLDIRKFSLHIQGEKVDAKKNIKIH